ncbi:glycosyltransferase family 4 protein [Thioalkalivibrio sp. ALJ16]|uniref:glycosyltransferase family 4 protein n=1 Tax=Thioalkalivibrio sp. ALJ16 TaxID=1158762 RepID=UPI00037BCD10|nr:glycosyltransferase family 4 protein [Thioalkalivibrio sp. ALJ16]
MTTILQVVPALEAGGVERGTLEIGQAVADAGHRSLVMSAGGRMVPELERQGSEHFAWPIGNKSPWTFRLVRPLRRFLQQQRVDVIDVRSRMPAWVVWRAWSRMPAATRPRLVTSVHGFNSVNRYSEILTRGERVVTVSETLRRFLLEQYPRLDEQRIEVIHRGVDTREYNPGFRPSPSWVAQWEEAFPQLHLRHVLTLPGRITRLKGHFDGLDILQGLLQRSIPAHLLVVGGTDPRKKDYQRELQGRISELGLASHVTFTGQRSDLREILASSNAVLSISSQPESFGRTTLEALSLGRPVLGYDHGGVGEQLAQLLPEGLIPAGHTQRAVERLAEWAKRSPPHPRWPHSWDLDSMCQRTLALYGKIAER